jgi:hypothetical protein
MTYDEIIARTEEILKATFKPRKGQTKAAGLGAILKWLDEEHGTLEALNLLGCKELEERGLSKDAAREIVLFWRKANRPEQEEVSVVVDLGPDAEATRLGPKRLVEKYDPDLQPDAYGKRLAEIAGLYTNNAEAAPKFLIFDDDIRDVEPTINRELTKEELAHLKGVGATREVAIYDGLPYVTFAVGGRPARYADQSPWDWQEILYQGESNAGIPWGRLPLETRQLVFIASAMIKEPDIQKFTEFELFGALELAEGIGKGRSLALAARFFPKSFVQFKEYQRQQHLPAMKVVIGAGPGGTSPT